MKADSRQTHLMLRIGTLVTALSLGVGLYSQVAKGRKAESSKQLDKVIPMLRAAYAVFNRGDFDAAVANLYAHIEWTEPAEFPGGRTYHGRAAVKGYLRQSREGWEQGSSEPERFITAGNRIVVFVHARFRPKGSNEWKDVRLADVYTMRHGKIVEMDAFADRGDALKWAGATMEQQ